MAKKSKGFGELFRQQQINKTSEEAVAEFQHKLQKGVLAINYGFSVARYWQNLSSIRCFDIAPKIVVNPVLYYTPISAKY